MGNEAEKDHVFFKATYGRTITEALHKAGNTNMYAEYREMRMGMPELTYQIKSQVVVMSSFDVAFVVDVSMFLRNMKSDAKRFDEYMAVMASCVVAIANAMYRGQK